MSLETIEADLRERMSYRSVSEVEEIPFHSYDEFQNLYNSNKIKILSQYDGNLVNYFGSKGEAIMHMILTWSPGLIIVALIITAVFMSNYKTLWGIPLALLGFSLSSPAFMKGVGYFILLLGFVAFVYFCFKNSTNAFILGSYVFSNFFVTVAREQCRIIVQDIILKSELVFIWLYIRKIIRIVQQNN